MARVAPLLCSLFALGAVVSCGESRETATLVISDVRVWTGDTDQPWAEAVAVSGDRILAVGSNKDVERYKGNGTYSVEYGGAMLVPGFIDTHVHFADGGAGLASVQLRDAQSPDEFSKRIADFAATLDEGDWVLEGTWDHENWGGELPHREWFDALTPNTPVWVTRLDGHMGVANSKALQLAGIDADTPDIDGGEIVRDTDGRPTGVLKDNAMWLVYEAIPTPSDAEMDRRILSAMDYVASNGVTTVHDMGNFNNIATFRRLHQQEKLITRIYAATPLAEWQQLQADVEAHGRGDLWLKTGALKGFMDGSLGSHTAAFFEPFTDAPDDRGFLINTLEDMGNWVQAADAAGLHVVVHAIGDRAITDLLDIYLDAVEANGDRDRRFRIEHAQHIRPADIERFKAQNVIASMQPYHAIDDGRWAEKVIGPERAETTYAFASLINSGARVAFGSDWSVAPATPIEGIYAAVTRRTLDDRNPDGWVPAQKVSVEDALRAYTVEGAYASYDEDNRGMIRAGMLADLVLLDRDLTAIDPEAIRDTRVLMTIVGGDIVFSAE